MRLKAPDPDRMSEWPYSKVRLHEINSEMGDGILIEIGETLKLLPCMHGKNHGDATPPMFFRERMLCVMNALRKRITELGGDDPWAHLKDMEGR